MATQRGFSFIVSDGPDLPKDPQVRTVIRKQAMRGVAVARRKRNADSKSLASRSVDNGTDNLERTLVPDDSSASNSSSASPDTTCTELIPSQQLAVWNDTMTDEEYERWFIEDMFASGLKILTPLTPCEKLRAEHQLDINVLSSFTDFNVSSMSVTSLADPEKLHSLLGTQIYSYLSFVPSRYGVVQSVTAATDCVLAKLASRLDPDDTRKHGKALSLYAKALDEVQKAVSDPIQACQTETLCAVSLLGLHELLDPGRLSAWKHHVAGSANIIKHRKAASFASEYEKALLYAHLGPAVTEALIAFNTCYLEAPEWHRLLLSFAEETTWLTNRSILTVRIRLNETYLPGLLKDVHDASLDETIFTPRVNEALLKRAKFAHDDMLQCLDDYKAHILQTSLLSPPENQLQIRRELFGGAIEGLCVYKRIMGAIDDSKRIRYEEEGQALALLLRDLQVRSSGKIDWLFKDHELGVASCMEVGADLWAADCRDKSEKEQHKLAVERWLVFAVALTQWEE